MYRDEKEALKARRDALKRETTEVETHLKAIKDLRNQKIMKALQAIAPWKHICAVSACVLALGSSAAMWGLLLTDTSPKPKAVHASFDELDASYMEEYGTTSPKSDELAQHLTQFSTSENTEDWPTVCDWRVERNTTNDDDFGVVFVLDTSVSMTPYLEDVKWTISAYAKDATAVSYALMTTYTDNSRGMPFLTRDRETFVSFVSQSRINPSVDEEYIPLRMEEAANLGLNMIIAFTDESPMVPADYSNDRFNALNGLCALRYGNPYFAVFTTPQNVVAWKEVGSCIRVFGDL